MADSWHGYALTGGHVALDLVNTLSWRLSPERTFDRLPMPGFVPRWLVETGLTSAALDCTRVTTDLIELRETICGICTGGPTTERFSEFVAAAHIHAVAELDLPLRWTVPIAEPEDVVHALALAADELLRSPDAKLIRECSGHGCGWLFVDRTRNHSRQWCSSQDCGNRERGRRHRQRGTRPG
ncbi:MAG: CGNR zinc finger domain-containing protein [Kibdelosporangium sp.]